MDALDYSMIEGGDQEWRPLSGSRGPETNEYGLDVLSRRFSGPKDKFLAFRDGFPIGAADETFPALTVSKILPISLAAGMMECEIEFVGVLEGGDGATRPPMLDDTIEPADVEVPATVSGISYFKTRYANGSVVYLPRSVSFTHPATASMYIPSTTYRYVRKARPSAPSYLAQGAGLFNPESPTASLQVFSLRPKPIQVPPPGAADSSTASAFQFISCELPDTWGSWAAPTWRLQSRQRGRWWEVEETIEIRLIPPAAA